MRARGAIQNLIAPVKKVSPPTNTKNLVTRMDLKCDSTFGSSLGPFLSRKGQYPPVAKTVYTLHRSNARKAKVKKYGSGP